MVALSGIASTTHAGLLISDLEPVPLPDSGAIVRNQWRVSGEIFARATADTNNQLVSASTSNKTLPGVTGLVAVDAKGSETAASASARITPTKLGASTASNQLGISSISGAYAFSQLSYSLIKDVGGGLGDYTLDLHLKGTLATPKGGIGVFSPIFAGFGALAIGSSTDPNNSVLRVVPDNIDDNTPILDAIQAYEISAANSNDHVQLQVEHVGGDLFSNNSAEIDSKFSVTASAIPVDLPDDTTVYFYFFQVYLVSFTQNTAISDFLGTLEVDALHVPVGTKIDFLPGQEIPIIYDATAGVPEPGTLPLMLGGLAIFWGIAIRRKTS